MPCVLVVHFTEIAQSLYREITQKARNETQRVEHLAVLARLHNDKNESQKISGISAHPVHMLPVAVAR